MKTERTYITVRYDFRALSQTDSRSLSAIFIFFEEMTKSLSETPFWLRMNQ